MQDCSMIGRNLRELRIRSGLNLAQASELTGVSKTMLSQIERSESVPTITVLWKIVNGLKIKFETLFITHDDEYVRNLQDVTPIISENKDVYIYNILPFAPLSGFDACCGIFKPQCDYTSIGHINGKMEYFIVTEGEIELITQNVSYLLKKNDFITFDPSFPHRYINHGSCDAILHMILCYH